MTQEQTEYYLKVLDVVCKVCKVKPEQLLGRRRDKRYAEARQMMYLLLDGHIPPKEIIWKLRRDRSTIIRGRDRIRDMIWIYKDTRKTYLKILKKINHDYQNDTEEA